MRSTAGGSRCRRSLVQVTKDLIDLWPLGRGQAPGLLEGGAGQFLVAAMQVRDGHADEGIRVVGIRSQGVAEVLDGGAVLLAHQAGTSQARVGQAGLWVGGHGALQGRDRLIHLALSQLGLAGSDQGLWIVCIRRWLRLLGSGGRHRDGQDGREQSGQGGGIYVAQDGGSAIYGYNVTITDNAADRTGVNSGINAGNGGGYASADTTSVLIVRM